jgi:NADH:ubiquinone oxidoreductase subunit 6 (subunit J)
MSDLAFIVAAVLTILSAILSLESKEIVYGAISLAISLFGVASLFFLLNAPYVAAFQIIIYIGAIAVLIIFTVMLVRQERWAKELPPRSISRVTGIAVALLIALSFFISVMTSRLYTYTDLAGNPGIAQIGQLISENFSLVLEVLALVLAASIIGALTLAKQDREEETV